MDNGMDRVVAAYVRGRPLADVPPGFAGRVMAHVRERAQEALDGWFVRRVAWPLMTGGGAAAVGFGLAWMWLWQAGIAAELSWALSSGTPFGF